MPRVGGEQVSVARGPAPEADRRTAEAPAGAARAHRAAGRPGASAALQAAARVFHQQPLQQRPIRLRRGLALRLLKSAGGRLRGDLGLATLQAARCIFDERRAAAPDPGL